MSKILIVDGESSYVNSLTERLLHEGYKVETADSACAAIRKLPEAGVDIVLSDKANFDELMAGAGFREYFAGPVIVLTNPKNCRAAVEVIKSGARDIVMRNPCDLAQLLKSLRECDGLAASGTHVAAAADMAGTPTRHASYRNASGSGSIEMIGNSAVMMALRRFIAKVAPADSRVLITGGNGTGKELVARMIHRLSHRHDKPFVEVNCAAIPSELIESELFGHEKGAFTSAVRQRSGRFEQAHGGTLFLDEVGDMSPSAQAKVLRALQEQKITRVGGEGDIQVNVRVIAATNKNLREEIAKGNFREDLYHRLTVIVINVPALNRRREDIPLLVEHFTSRYAADNNMAGQAPPVTPEAMEELVKHDWTGNIRELQNAVERLMVLCDREVTAADVRSYVNHE